MIGLALPLLGALLGQPVLPAPDERCRRQWLLDEAPPRMLAGLSSRVLADGGLRSTEYRDGRRDGAYFEWHANGQLASQGAFVADREDGLWSAWYEDGKPRWLGAMRAGRRTGEWLQWHDTGVLWTQVSYVEGQKEGLWLMWSRDGRLVQEGCYRDDLEDGVWTVYDKGGAVRSQIRYEAGRQVPL